MVDELEALVTRHAAGADARDEVRVLIHIAFREIGRDQKVLRIVMREGDNFPELRDRFHDRIVRRGHAQTAERLRRLAERGGRGAALDLDALAAVLLAPIISYRRPRDDLRPPARRRGRGALPGHLDALRA